MECNLYFIKPNIYGSWWGEIFYPEKGSVSKYLKRKDSVNIINFPAAISMRCIIAEMDEPS